MRQAAGDVEQVAAGWPEAARPDAQVWLAFDTQSARGESHPAHDISAAARVGDTLFLAADESASLEILDWDGERFADHRRIRLQCYFDLPGGDDEMDIEGLAVDGDWLWVVGSHSLTRRKPSKKKSLDDDALERLAELKGNPNRMFLGRLPLRQAPGRELWDVDDAATGARRPQMLAVGKRGSLLQRRLQDDPHIGPFCALPVKENGLDVEGLVVDGARVGLGLRGPVINGWAIVVEAQVRPDKDGELMLDGPLEKYFLDLNGLGIRDLKRRGDDVIVLAGPTMKLDGPAAVFRWSGWKQDGSARRLQTPERLLDLPFGRDCDHPEAVALFDLAGDDALLVVSDHPGDHRLAGGAVLADVFRYPDR
ncbi:DUF3616 domain-containing protein [Phenylobacterium sp. LjRoot219]|uniref:DUF3616 domain-containing protein n=1 Tax=Phenylobacterium sp. LjRoot219 TaxID=3342283 RepID=UPI003ED022DD